VGFGEGICLEAFASPGVAFPSMPGSRGKPSKKRFAALVLKRLKAAGAPTDYVFDPEAFQIRGGSTRGFLGNTYEAYCRARGARRNAILDNLVAVLLPEDDEEMSFDEARDKLVAAVREREYFALASLQERLGGEKEPMTLLHEPISEWFARTLVVDFPNHMRIVDRDAGLGWDQTTGELSALGLERLKDRAGPRFADEGGVFRGLWNDEYDSSRILVPGIFDALPLKGDPVVALPNRLTLLAAGSDDPAAIKRMLAMAERIVRTKLKPQNPAPLIIRGGQIGDFDVPPGSPIFNDVQRARKLAALFAYEAQQKALERLYRKDGKDLSVASHGLGQLEDGSYSSWAVWTRDVPTLLPAADTVVFVDLELLKHNRVVARVPWERVLASLSDSMLDTKMFPPRWYVSRFPSEEQIRTMLHRRVTAPRIKAAAKATSRRAHT